MQAKTVSIIIINFNGLHYLEKTLHSIISQDYPNLEFIVVDNGSTDGSIEYLQQFKELNLLQSSRYREKNYACNFGVLHATGEYILLLDNDIKLIDNELVSKLLQFYTILNNPGAIGLAVHDENEKLSSRYGSYFGYYFIREVKKYTIDIIKSFHGIKVPATGGQIFIRKDIWVEAGGYDDHLVFGGDDNDLGIRLTLMGYNNFLYSQSNQVHLGINNRLDNKTYIRRFAETFYAHLYTIVKNYKMHNMIIALFIYPCFTLAKSFKQAVQRIHPGPIWAFFKGLYFFITNIHVALDKRNCIQKNRAIKNDIFLKMDPPSPGNNC